MREISLHLMDIIENSITANATLIELYIEIDTNKNKLLITIKDNGKGIEKEMLKNITDPFVTSRTTRKVGLGLSLFKSTCQRCNGDLTVNSEVGVGTVVKADMEFENIDRPPLGKIEETIVSALLTPNIDFYYKHTFNGKEFEFNTKEVKTILETDDLNSPEILIWIRDYIKENLMELMGGASL